MATESLPLAVLLGSTGTALVAYALHRRTTLLRRRFSRRRFLLTAAMAASLASVAVRLLPGLSGLESAVPSFGLAAVALSLFVRAWNADESTVANESAPHESASDSPGHTSSTVGRADSVPGGVHAPDSVASERLRGAIVALSAVAAVAVAVALADSLTARAAITVVVAVPLGRLFGYVANCALAGRDGRENGSG